MALKDEIAAYESALPEMLNKSGKYVVFYGGQALGFFDTYVDALQAACKELGPDDEFLLREVQPQKPSAVFTRWLDL